MKRKALFSLLLCVLVAGTLPFAKEGLCKEQDATTVKFTRFSYQDTQGIGTEAFSMLIPAGWQFEGEVEWIPLKFLEVGANVGMYIENTPSREIEEITYNARPYFSITPFNNLNLRVYLDNLWLHSTGRLERLVGGFLFSFNFLPKSWIYLALNEGRARNVETDAAAGPAPSSRA